jgi:hypothetical protein
VKLDSALSLKKELVDKYYGSGVSTAIADTGSPSFPGTSIGVFAIGKDDFGIEIGLKNRKQVKENNRRLLKSSELVKVGESEKRLVATGNVIAASSSNKRALCIPAKQGPVSPGDSVGHWMNASGSLGCYLADPANSSWLGALSNNHVFVHDNTTTSNDTIISPGRTDSGMPPHDNFAKLSNFEVIDINAGAANQLDVADAEVNQPKRRPANPRIIPGIGILSGVVIPEKDIPNLVASKALVKKRGRTTAGTTGVISSTNVNVSVSYPFAANLTFDPVIAVRHSSGYQPFAERGDSGSLLVVPTGKTDPTTGLELLDAVGLIFAVTSHQYSKRSPHTTYVIPLEPALKFLGKKLY